jgi:hypothetical protein
MFKSADSKNSASAFGLAEASSTDWKSARITINDYSVQPVQ